MVVGCGKSVGVLVTGEVDVIRSGRPLVMGAAVPVRAHAVSLAHEPEGGVVSWTSQVEFGVDTCGAFWF
jgi:hypothetical protein